MFKFTTANATVITVTNTAAALSSLIDTAASTDNQNIPSQINAAFLYAEDGDIRFTTDGNNPTTTKGLILKQGSSVFLSGIRPKDIILISVSGSNVKVDVSVGQSDSQDKITMSGGSGQIQGGVASGATDSGNPVKTGGVYNTTPPTLTNGQRGDTQMDQQGDTLMSLGTKIAGEDLTNDRMLTAPKYNYTNIPAGQATSVIKASAGILRSITFHGAATATNTTTVYDNASGAGTVIARPAATAVTAPTTVTYDIAFTTGLTIITATANGCDMTVAWL